MGRPSERWFQAALVLLLAAVAGLALEVRWSRAAREDGPALRPRPDAVEYAAGAQAIVQAGRYYLQVGPYRVRPRYAPGWPLLLAGALAAGVEPAELWRVAAGFDAGLACLLAVGVTLAVRRLTFDRARAAPGRLAAAALGAGLFAGVCWALAPLAVEVSTVALSDTPAAFASALCLACAIFVCARAQAVRPARLTAWTGGLALGLAASIRPVSGALLLPPLAVLLLGGPARRAGGEGFLRRAAAGLRSRAPFCWLAGAAVLPLATMALLARSGLHPLSWSGYGFWVPQRFASLGDTFNWRFALQGVAEFGRGPGGEPVPHFLFCLRVLGGLPGLREGSGLGPWWPLAGWLAAGYLGWTARQPSRASAGAQAPQKAQRSQEAQGPQGAHDGKGLLRQVTAALAIFAAGYLVLYSFYFFPSARFLLPPLLIPAGSLAVLCGLGLARGKALPGAAALAGVLLVLAVTTGELSERRQAPGGTAAAADPEEETRELFYWWAQLPEWRRARRMVPFDPVEAQALGLLPPVVARSIRVWGELPPTVHVRRLQGMGLIPRLPGLDGRAK